ncbi:rhamnulokinase [Brachyspira murdochii]|uniref:Carbohydrate kinase, FGGY-like protein n=1 Tax=Brachyspira murdochii (strain ATCC 51284 / DSM 12563 / 56-150) TaxID=526224 RepID=D5U664_BRAM5|nr:rhamnulokinase family protein [Brachyspira murdochii]ADG72563.1 Carbohydrate kinase, FGGY-like protein [Brachyspira murdochii DSM 12563]
MTNNKFYSIACDFGSSGGKIFLSKFENDKMTLEEVHRFSLTPIRINNYYYTDFIYMYNELLKGIKKVADMGVQPSSLGINSWGVDYAYINKNGELLSNPINYRDTRTINTIKKLEKIGLNAKKLYGITGISCMPFNSIMQIYEDIEKRADIVNNAEKLLFTPDLFCYFLTGNISSEYTISSTSQLIDINKKNWSSEILEAINFDINKLPVLIEAGTKKGLLKQEIADYLGLKPFDIIAAASHDTASAVLSAPIFNDTSAYLSSGSWSLLGVELKEPILTDEALENGFTNEMGYNNTIRFLENINGLWTIQLLQKKYQISFNDMEKLARDNIKDEHRIDITDNRFYNPKDIEDEILNYYKDTNQSDVSKDSKGIIIASVYNSLADSYAKYIDSLKKILNKNIDTLCIVGGGTRDKLICELTKEKTNLNVYVGPIECTAAGNILAQFKSLGILKDTEEMRKLVVNSFEIKKI